MMVQGEVVGDLIVGTEVQEIRPLHYLKNKQKPPPSLRLGYPVKKKKPPKFVVLAAKSSRRLDSLLQKGCRQRGLHWHCCQAHFLLKFYSSVTNVFLSQPRVILMQAATGKGSCVLPSCDFLPPLLCQHQHLCAYETQPDKEKKSTYKLIFS